MDDDTSCSHTSTGAAACVRQHMLAADMVIEATPMALRTSRDQVHLLK